MGLGVAESLQRVVRAALGLDPEPTSLPAILHLGLYPARVDAAAADGSTLDVTPVDTRFKPMQQVPFRAGIAGAVVVVKVGGVVRLGWDGGDPSRPYCSPCWDAGCGVTSIDLTADTINLNATTINLKAQGVTAQLGSGKMDVS